MEASLSPDPGQAPAKEQVLTADAVRLGLSAADKWDALRQCGEVLVEIGAATPEYAAAILEREKSVSTFMGEGVAIPHGTDASRTHINRAALAVLQFPDGVDWDGNEAKLAIAIASKSDEHLRLLQSLALVLSVPEQAARLRGATHVSEVLELLAPDEEDDDE